MVWCGVVCIWDMSVLQHPAPTETVTNVLDHTRSLASASRDEVIKALKSWDLEKDVAVVRTMATLHLSLILSCLAVVHICLKFRWRSSPLPPVEANAYHCACGPLSHAIVVLHAQLREDPSRRAELVQRPRTSNGPVTVHPPGHRSGLLISHSNSSSGTGSAAAAPAAQSPQSRVSARGSGSAADILVIHDPSDDEAEDSGSTAASTRRMYDVAFRVPSSHSLLESPVGSRGNQADSSLQNSSSPSGVIARPYSYTPEVRRPQT
jgi:hypothetical protein